MAVRLWQTGPLSLVWVFCARCEPHGRDVDKIHFTSDESRSVRVVTISCHGGKMTFEISDQVLNSLNHRLNVQVFGDKLVGVVYETYRHDALPPVDQVKPVKSPWFQGWLKDLTPPLPPDFNLEGKLQLPVKGKLQLEDWDYNLAFHEVHPAPAAPVLPKSPGRLEPQVPILLPPARRRIILPEDCS